MLDEEQESTYKSDMSPKYHARDVAKYRAAANGALLLMASATPSVESFYEAQSGKYELVTLTKRYCGDTLPAVTVADMRLSEQNPEEFIGETLREELLAAYQRGMQSMLFLNRRGYSSMLLCRACGEAVLCLFDRFGNFNTALGRSGANPMGGEEKDFFAITVDTAFPYRIFVRNAAASILPLPDTAHSGLKMKSLLFFRMQKSSAWMRIPQRDVSLKMK